MQEYTLITRAPVETPIELHLAALSLESVEFDLVDNAGHVVRHATVQVGSARNWKQAVRFPNLASRDGETTGDDVLDERIRARAAEELTRLAAWRSAA